MPGTVEELRRARQGKTERVVFLSADARAALADYLERPRDAGHGATALFLSAVEVPARAPEGRLSLRAINLLLEQIGRWHDAEVTDPARRLAPLRPHDLRHTFAFHLAQRTGADTYEFERRLGHRAQRYKQRYTNPLEEIAARYVEEFRPYSGVGETGCLTSPRFHVSPSCPRREQTHTVSLRVFCPYWTDHMIN